MRSSRTLLAVAVFLALLWSAFGLAGERARERWKMEGFKKPSEQELRQALTPLQFGVTQEEGTEPPFDNKYWDSKRAGIYVDVVSGEPLFSSLDKFDSGTGWPSFTRPLEAANIVERGDHKLVVRRVELRSKHGDSHLGHVFDDGPPPTGMRYCINSAALRFVPLERLEEEGYGKYLPLFATGDGTGSPPEGTDRGPGHSQVRAEEVAVLAGGCFWGVEEIVRKLPGVIDTEVGYTGGSLPQPGYKDVVRGTTGHAEAVRVVFDPRVLSYEALLEYFFRLHDPTTKNQQGNDVGTQYRSAVFYASEEQKKAAERVRERVARSGRWKDKIVTEIVKAAPFYPAEEYHQDYLQKNPGGYTCHYLRD